MLTIRLEVKKGYDLPNTLTYDEEQIEFIMNNTNNKTIEDVVRSFQKGAKAFKITSYKYNNKWYVLK